MHDSSCHRLEGGKLIIGLPAHEVCPFDRLELAVRQFQRFWLMWRSPRNIDHANEACTTPRRLSKPTPACAIAGARADAGLNRAR
jgi:hypothetical protein